MGIHISVPYDVIIIVYWEVTRMTAASSRDQTSVSQASLSVKVNSRGRTVLMLTISIDKPVLLRFSHVKCRSHQKFLRINATWKRDSKSSHPRKMEELSVELPTQTIPHCEPSKHPDLQFDRLQPSDEDLDQEKKLEFGQFVAREATLDEEYWTAAWLRAESHWEEQKNDRFADSNKRKFADRAFNAIKRRAKGQNGQLCTCIVTVKKDTKNVKRTVVKSVVGTLDLSIRYLLDGETFPGERVKAPLFCSTNRTQSSRYGYISNLCVAKAARRQGIASNMLQFAIRSAILNANVEQIYVHVDRKNKPAQELYRKMGFEIIERANSQLSEEQTYLLCFKT
ncbi:GCN5-related N-acetyltransferase 6, chloroplastic-like isoform X2 [Malus domestica]|uniref:GCN5-related N-acetyltransferase 6, chloroplastic-like isoform X2 n=1 Tax=Malus domestica TaxID=3750 RepID=UPI003974CAA9